MVCGIIRLAGSPEGGSPLIRLTPINVALDAYTEALRNRGGSTADHTWLSLLNDDQFAGRQQPVPRSMAPQLPDRRLSR